MLNYPFLIIFDKDVLILGIPLTVLYFYIGWPVSIFVIYLFSVYLGRHSDKNSAENTLENSPPGGAT
jgi:hypothetical protein